jgi:hypothetical protein
MSGESIAFNVASEQAKAHRRRCKALPPLQPGEPERLMAAFLAVRSITQCPVRYAVPLQHGPQPIRSSY